MDITPRKEILREAKMTPQYSTLAGIQLEVLLDIRELLMDRATGENTLETPGVPYKE